MIDIASFTLACIHAWQYNINPRGRTVCPSQLASLMRSALRAGMEPERGLEGVCVRLRRLTPIAERPLIDDMLSVDAPLLIM